MLIPGVGGASLGIVGERFDAPCGNLFDLPDDVMASTACKAGTVATSAAETPVEIGSAGNL